MLEVTKNFVLLIKKRCFSSLSMLQDSYNLTRSWRLTSYGRYWQNRCMDRDQGGRSVCGQSSRSGNGGERFEFSLMTYNILSQEYIQQFMNLYGKCPEGSLEWPNRRERLACELKEANPDIVCLQEVNSIHHFQFFKPFLNHLGYSGVYKKRTGSRYDGCAIYYKDSKFILVDHIDLELSRCDVTPLLNKDNVAIIGVLKPQSWSSSSDSRRLIVATTHLIFSPSRGDTKLAQIRLLLAELDSLISSIYSRERKKCSLILCGDMNAEPHSPFYDFITKGFLDTKGCSYGDLSGQSEGTGRGALFKPSDLDLNGVSRSTRFVKKNSKDNQISNGSVHSNSNSSSNNSSSQSNANKNKIQEDDQKERPEDNHDGKWGKCRSDERRREDFLKDSKRDENAENEETSSISHHFKFRSVYPTRDSHNLPLVTTHHAKASCMVDYIFYNRSDDMELLGYSRLLNKNQMKKVGHLPNFFIGSDHLSLHAKFLIKNDPKKLKKK